VRGPGRQRSWRDAVLPADSLGPAKGTAAREREGVCGSAGVEGCGPLGYGGGGGGGGGGPLWAGGGGSAGGGGGRRGRGKEWVGGADP